MVWSSRWLLVLAVVACAAVLFAAGATASVERAPTAQAPEGATGPAQTYTISGTVRDTLGNPIADAQIIGFGSGSPAIGQSGIGGQYILTVSADTYDVQAFKTGYYAGHVFGVTVPPSQTNIDFALSIMSAVTPSPSVTPTRTATPTRTSTPTPTKTATRVALVSSIVHLPAIKR